MPTDRTTVETILAQCQLAGEVTVRAMFGEYGLYCDGKLVGSICDNDLFLTITPAGRAELDENHDAAPYPGAKPKHRIPRERWNDEEWLASLVRATAAALPAPKPKKPRASNRNNAR